jgi:hypothetical protein
MQPAAFVPAPYPGLAPSTSSYSSAFSGSYATSSDMNASFSSFNPPSGRSSSSFDSSSSVPYSPPFYAPRSHRYSGSDAAGPPFASGSADQPNTRSTPVQRPSGLPTESSPSSPSSSDQSRDQSPARSKYRSTPKKSLRRSSSLLPSKDAGQPSRYPVQPTSLQESIPYAPGELKLPRKNQSAISCLLLRHAS